MSWDKETSKHSCPCGNGTYTVTTTDSGWKETEDYSMDCPACKQNYVVWHGSRILAKPVWVPKSTHEKYEDAKEQHSEMFLDAVNSARESGIDTYDPRDAIMRGAMGADDLSGRLDEYNRLEELKRELEKQLEIESFR